VTANGDCQATGSSAADNSQFGLTMFPGIVTLTNLGGTVGWPGSPEVGTLESTTTGVTGGFTLTNADGQSWAAAVGDGTFTLTLVGIVDTGGSGAFIPHGTYSATLQPDVATGATGNADIAATF
jgi:hypothetical protein